MDIDTNTANKSRRKELLKQKKHFNKLEKRRMIVLVISYIPLKKYLLSAYYVPDWDYDTERNTSTLQPDVGYTCLF